MLCTGQIRARSILAVEDCSVSLVRVQDDGRCVKLCLCATVSRPVLPLESRDSRHCRIP